MSKAKRCVVITYPFPLGRASGGARMTREIARHIGKTGIEVVLLPVSASANSRFPRPVVADCFLGREYDSDLAEDSVHVLRIPQHRLHWRLDGRMVKRKLREVLDLRNVIAVLSYYHDGAFLGPMVQSRGIKFGYIATWQSYAWALNIRRRNVFRRWANRQYIVKPYRNADILFATSQFTRRELLEVVGVDAARVTVCPLGVEKWLLELPRKPPSEISRFVFFGRLVLHKGVLDAIEALAILAKKGYLDWTFRILGQGNQQWVKEAARKNGISDKVWVGQAVADDGLQEELKQAHLAIMPSHSESFGLSIAEAQAAALPVISYDVGSVPEVIENGVSGCLAPLGRVDILAACIEEMVNDPEKAFHAGLAGRERMSQRFRWSQTASIIVNGVNASS